MHKVRESLPQNVLLNLLSFHAMTGCDSSQFCGHGKKSAWPVYVGEPSLLDPLSADNAPDYAKAECFVVKLYCPLSTLTSVNDLRAELFHRVSNPEKLPPTQNALMLHFKRCRHQVMIWKNSTVTKPVLSSPEESGWEITSDGSLSPILMTMEAVPAVCVELLTCGCKSRQCNTTRCTCNKQRMMCSLGCSCMTECQNPYRSQAAEDDSDSE